MVLRSSDSKQSYTNNQTNVHLPTPLVLRGNWTVALTELTMSQWNRNNFKPELFLCSDIVDHTVVGESEIPLLRRVYMKFLTAHIIYHCVSGNLVTFTCI